MIQAHKLIREAEGPEGLGFNKRNTTRFYNFVRPKKNGEAIVEMYVVRNAYDNGERPHRKLPKIEFFKACRWETDSKTMHFYGIGYCGLAGYQVCFPSDPYYDPMKYTMDYSFGCAMLIRNAWYLNDFTGTKYAHAGYDWSYGLHIMEFAELYHISPGVEFLAKAQLWKLMSPSFVRKLATDRGFFEFFRTNCREIRQWHYGLAVIRNAYTSGRTLAAAARRLRAEKKCQPVPSGLRRGEDPEKIVKYAKKAGCSLYQYGHYLELLHKNGRHLDEFGVRYPRDFHAAFNAIDEADSRRRRREQRAIDKAWREKEARRNKDIAAIAKDLAAISDREFGEWRVRFPVSEKELRAEGQTMHNCIGGYGERIAARRSVCFFIRAVANDKPVADVEVRDGRVVQCYAKGNTRPAQPVIELADVVAGLVKTIFKKAERKREETKP